MQCGSKRRSRNRDRDRDRDRSKNSSRDSADLTSQAWSEEVMKCSAIGDFVFHLGCWWMYLVKRKNKTTRGKGKREKIFVCNLYILFTFAGSYLSPLDLTLTCIGMQQCPCARKKNRYSYSHSLQNRDGGCECGSGLHWIGIIDK